MLKPLPKIFINRQAIINHVAELQQQETESITPIIATDLAQRLAAIDPIKYGKTRNHLTGAVTQLSPFISRGIVTTKQFYDIIKQRVTHPKNAYKLLQELAWREFWTHVIQQRPDWLWQDIEHYKTGWQTIDYADELPNDILQAKTDCACINQFINELYCTGYLHNHTRMYLAAYVVHWRRIKWQVGAEWFLRHLLDAYAPSNNLSWQWVASTFSHKPYIFNLDNIKKYADDSTNVSKKDNAALDHSYDSLSRQLFPNKVSGKK